MTVIGTRRKLIGAVTEPDPRKNLTSRDTGGICARDRTQVAGGTGGTSTGTACVESLAHHPFRNGSQLMSWEKSSCGPDRRLG